MRAPEDQRQDGGEEVRGLICRGTSDLQRAADVIRGLNPQKPWKVEFGLHKAKRSVEQNKLLWAIYTEMASGTGHTPEEIHEAMKAKFLPRRVITVGDEEFPILGSSAKLDVGEFSNFVEQVQVFAAQELGVVV